MLLFFKWLRTRDYRKKISLSIQLMYQFNQIKWLRRYFHRYIFYTFNCEIDELSEIDPSVLFVHPIGIVIGPYVKIGKKTTILQNVTIGGNQNTELKPQIGEQVMIYAGAKILGHVVLGDQVIVGANTVVTRSVPKGKTVVGVDRILD